MWGATAGVAYWYYTSFRFCCRKRRAPRACMHVTSHTSTPRHCMATASAVLLMPYPTRDDRVTFFLVTLCEIQMVTLCEIQMVTLCEIQMGALVCAQHAPVTRQPLSTPFTHRGAVARRSPLNTLHTQWHRETDPLALCFAPRCCGTEVTLLSMATNPLTVTP